MKEVMYIPGDLVKANNNPNIVWIVKNVSQDKRGNVLYEVIAADENDAFIYLYEHQIEPIPITPVILETNGWLFLNDGYIKCYQHPKDWRLQVQIVKGKYLAYLHDEVLYEINQVHQLQHLLFGLGLNSELKV